MTTRRSFFRTLATSVAGFTILPPATTYSRIWKAQRSIPNPAYVTAPYETKFIFNERALSGKWTFQFSPEPRFLLNPDNTFYMRKSIP